ncbi:rod shape-determining protein MreD [Brachyspira innocens]|uniref:Rod shape-determining protein MreD n=1 Tax=Brachyspira innocens TaxID=13264 RepID=A0ABT8YX55_9SPIR|nr:rod shape-determining protein MreD [Brachyspira innocens]MDO6993835.1 rod shape-determining protein MreD [Brachyspira innocens]MDO7019818.1 rod shape-determining protein MreD [Brachyspira innocens]
MKRVITVIITTLILLLIQSSPAYDLIRVALGAKPDLLLIFLVFISFRYGSFDGIIYGFIIGLLQDIVSSGTFGSYAIIFLNIGFFVGFFNTRIFIKQIAAGIFVTLVGYLIKIIALFLVTSIYSDLSNVAVLIRAELLVGLPLTVILSSPAFILFEKVAPIVYDKQGIHVDDSTTKEYSE